MEPATDYPPLKRMCKTLLINGCRNEGFLPFHSKGQRKIFWIKKTTKKKVISAFFLPTSHSTDTVTGRVLHFPVITFQHHLRSATTLGRNLIASILASCVFSPQNIVITVKESKGRGPLQPFSKREGGRKEKSDYILIWKCFPYLKGQAAFIRQNKKAPAWICTGLIWLVRQRRWDHRGAEPNGAYKDVNGIFLINEHARIANQSLNCRNVWGMFIYSDQQRPLY